MTPRIATAAALAASLALPAAAASLTTTFADNNGAAGNMFDVVVGAGRDITVTDLDLHLDDPASADYDVVLYARAGTVVGHTTSSEGWTLIDRATLTGQGTGNPTAWDVADFSLLAGRTYGLFVYNPSSDIEYTNGSALGAVAASNADLSILEGFGKGSGSATDFDGGTFGSTAGPSRIWNGTVTYDLGATAPVVTAPVPLPAGLPLLALGLGTLAAVRRRAT